MNPAPPVTSTRHSVNLAEPSRIGLDGVSIISLHFRGEKNGVSRGAQPLAGITLGVHLDLRRTHGKDYSVNRASGVVAWINQKQELQA
jgi:hypothetical protein